jgi:predicted ATPase
MLGQQKTGMHQIHQGLTAWRDTGLAVFLPYFLALHAEILTQTGQVDEGLRVVAEALTLVDAHGERWWEAELLRLKGTLLLQSEVVQSGVCNTPRLEEVEVCFHQALAVARKQHARSLELRAALSVSRLWQRQGKQATARQLLSEIYDWFTEGFATADLQEARTLLAALA